MRTSIANLTERQGGVTQTHQKAFHALPKVHRLRHRLSKVHRLRGTLGSSTTELAILPQPREPSLQPCTVCECCRERPRMIHQAYGRRYLPRNNNNNNRSARSSSVRVDPVAVGHHHNKNSPRRPKTSSYIQVPETMCPG